MSEFGCREGSKGGVWQCSVAVHEKACNDLIWLWQDRHASNQASKIVRLFEWRQKETGGRRFLFCFCFFVFFVNSCLPCFGKLSKHAARTAVMTRTPSPAGWRTCWRSGGATFQRYGRTRVCFFSCHAAGRCDLCLLQKMRHW